MSHPNPHLTQMRGNEAKVIPPERRDPRETDRQKERKRVSQSVNGSATEREGMQRTIYEDDKGTFGPDHGERKRRRVASISIWYRYYSRAPTSLCRRRRAGQFWSAEARRR